MKIVYCETCHQPIKPVASWLDSGQWCNCKEEKEWCMKNANTAERGLRLEYQMEVIMIWLDNTISSIRNAEVMNNDFRKKSRSLCLWSWIGGRRMKLRGDTYLRAHKKWRKDRLQEVIDLKKEVANIKCLLEWLCHEVIKDEWRSSRWTNWSIKSNAQTNGVWLNAEMEIKPAIIQKHNFSHGETLPSPSKSASINIQTCIGLRTEVVQKTSHDQHHDAHRRSG